jgi:hypothetical protein
MVTIQKEVGANLILDILFQQPNPAEANTKLRAINSLDKNGKSYKNAYFRRFLR